MLKIERILTSTKAYQQAFEEGLLKILNNKTSGTFILVCANIFQHHELLKKYKPILGEAFTHIKNYYQQCKQNNQQPNDAIDDITVMNKIISIGFNNLNPIQTKQLSTNATTYQINYNQLRSFRPARMSSTQDVCLNTVFNPDGFHFDKAFLKKEIFAEGKMNGRKISLLYNKFPFVEYHALLVLDKTQQHNQFLTKETLDYIFNLQKTCTTNIPELVITYNSIGAGASVNHLHFQVFIETMPLAIFLSDATHEDAAESYPAHYRAFKELNKCWGYLQQLHHTNTPYNLLFKNKKIICLPRKSATKTFSGFNVSSYGWAEMAGVFTLNDIDIFNRISLETLLETIASVSAKKTSTMFSLHL